MKKSKKVGILAFGSALVLFFSGCSTAAVQANAGLDEPARTAVEVNELTRSTIKNELTYIGQVEAQKTITVASKLAAEVVEVYFDIGDVVEEGDVLFTVDAKDLRDQIATLQASAAITQAAVQSAQYGVEVAQEGSVQERIAELTQEYNLDTTRDTLRSARDTRDDLRDDRNDLKDAVKSMEDYYRAVRDDLQFMQGNLVKLQGQLAGADTQEQIDELTAQIEALEGQISSQSALANSVSADLTELEATYEKVKSGYVTARDGANSAQRALEYTRESNELSRELTDETKERSVMQAQYALQAAQAQANSSQVALSIAQSSLGYAEVKSPLSGVISTRSVEAGQMISQAAMPFTIIQMDTVNIQVQVSETLINSIFPGDQVEVSIQALGDTFSGVVTAVSPAAGATSTYPIRIELPNPEGLIKPGMFAQVVFVENQRDNTFVLDKNVVFSDEESQYVYVIRDGVAQKVTVTTGISNGTSIEVISGLAVGDQVVVVGQEYLIDGTLVNVVKLDGELVTQPQAQTEEPAAQEEEGENDQAQQDDAPEDAGQGDDAQGETAPDADEESADELEQS